MGKSIIIKTDELQYYLKDLKKIPVISHEREDEIFELLKKGEKIWMYKLTENAATNEYQIDPPTKFMFSLSLSK